MKEKAAPLSIDLIAAARPNFMKVAPLYHALRRTAGLRPRLVHTGQHYDPNMSAAFFRDLKLPEPDIHLGVGSGTHAQQTANVMVAYDKVCRESRPDLIVVVGDVNSTLACALVGVKEHITVAHLEAGLRSRDRTMPEEINRIATDAVADILWTPSPDADENLVSEGVPPQRVTRVGNIMIDSFEFMREQIAASTVRDELDLRTGDYAMVTLHRPVNVDGREPLTRLVTRLGQISRDLPLIFPVHPRTRKNIDAFDLWPLFDGGSIKVIEPLGYIDFMHLVLGARLVITDSGGIQEETTYLGIPCLTVRESTERPITLWEGTNRLVNGENLGAAVSAVLQASAHAGKKPALWDGRTAERVTVDIRRRLLQDEAGSDNDNNTASADELRNTS